MRRLSCLLGVCALAAGCATAPPPAPAPEPAPVVPAPALPPPPACAVCVDRTDEIARLRQDLATRDAELRDLRSSQREQVKAVQESTREVTRAKARVRRLATQADAASSLAEVEVALAAARSATPSPLLGLARAFLEAAQAPFAQGDYASAMDRAAQAEQLVTAAASGAPAASRNRIEGEVLLQAAIPLKASGESRLRRAPEPRAAVVGTVGRDAALVAHAYKGAWMRVETDDGKLGWVPQAELSAR